jgi:hypothetical protein
MPISRKSLSSFLIEVFFIETYLDFLDLIFKWFFLISMLLKDLNNPSDALSFISLVLFLESKTLFSKNRNKRIELKMKYFGINNERKHLCENNIGLFNILYLE